MSNKQSFNIFTFDNLLHFVGGALLSGIVASGFWYPWTLVFTVPILIAVEGLLREQTQARSWKLSDWLLKKHKLTEGLMWGVGSAFAMVIIFLFWR